MRVEALGVILACAVRQERTGYDNPWRMRIYNFFMARDILIRPLGNVFYLMPPYTIEEEALHNLHRAVEDFVQHEMGGSED